MLPDWATAAADEVAGGTRRRIGQSERRVMSRERWMALFCSRVGVLPDGPFPGYVQLVGESADAITFFVGSILFTAGEGSKAGYGPNGTPPVADARHGGPPSCSPPARCSSTSRRTRRWTPR